MLLFGGVEETARRTYFKNLHRCFVVVGSVVSGRGAVVVRMCREPPVFLSDGVCCTIMGGSVIVVSTGAL